jgi:hypothetical protein
MDLTPSWKAIVHLAVRSLTNPRDKRNHSAWEAQLKRLAEFVDEQNDQAKRLERNTSNR